MGEWGEEGRDRRWGERARWGQEEIKRNTDDQAEEVRDALKGEVRHQPGSVGAQHGGWRGDTQRHTENQHQARDREGGAVKGERGEETTNMRDRDRGKTRKTGLGEEQHK